MPRESRISLATAMTIAVFASGCGDEQATTGPQASTASPVVAINSSAIPEVPGNDAVNTKIAIDATSLGAGGRLAEDYKAAASAAAEPTITRGGQLTVELFGRVNGRALTIYEESVPDRSIEGANIRGSSEAIRRESLAGALDIALGLTTAEPDIARQITDVRSGRGSDIARAAGQAMRDAGEDGIAVILSDGLLDEGGVRARDLFGGEATADAASDVAAIATNGYSVPTPRLLRIAGIGATAGKLDIASGDAEVLVDLWTRVCRDLGVTRCEITQAL